MDIDYTEFIYWILDEMDLQYDYIERQDKGDYILCQNPLVSDNIKSMQIYLDGYAKSHNSMIDGKSRIHIKEIARKTGHLQEYISYILQQTNIPSYYVNSYRDLIIKKNLKEYYNFKSYKKYVSIFGEYFISQSDLMGINEVKSINKEKFINKTKKKKKRSSMEEVETTDKEYIECIEYIKSRGLNLLGGVVEARALEFQSGYRKSVIAFKYPNNEFSKYRLTTSIKDLRYLSKGLYNNMFVAQESNDKNICFLIEGEFESLSFTKYCSCTVKAIHNCNSLGKMKDVKDYNRLVILIDGDKYNEIRKDLRLAIKSIYPNKKINILRKIRKFDTLRIIKENKDKISKELNLESKIKLIDYNWLLCNNENKLKEIIDKIN